MCASAFDVYCYSHSRVSVMFCRLLIRRCINETNDVLTIFRTSSCRRYSTETSFPTTCPGANYKKDGEEVVLRADCEYPDWLWKLGGPKKDFKDMSPEEDGKSYYRRLRKMTIRHQNLVRKQRKF